MGLGGLYAQRVNNLLIYTREVYTGWDTRHIHQGGIYREGYPTIYTREAYIGKY